MSSKTAASNGPPTRPTTPARSIASRLQITIVLVIGLFVGVWTLVLDVALVRGFDAEDAEMMRAQAEAVRSAAGRGDSIGGALTGRAPKIEWQLLAEDGRALAQTAGWDLVRGIDWSETGPEPLRFEQPGETSFDALSAVVIMDGRSGTVRVAMDRSHEGEIINDYRRVLWGGLLVLLLVVVQASRVIVQRGLRPLDQIAAEVTAVAPHHMDLRLEVDRFPVELARLVHALNATLGRIDEAFGRLGRMSSDLAHELRTPLQNMRAEVEALVLRPPGPAETGETLGSLLEELDRLGDMIEQILFLARAEDPRQAIDRRPLDAAAVLAGTAAFFEAVAADVGVTIEVEAPVGILVAADERLLQRVLHNLVANAIRHAGDGGHVCLGASLTAGDGIHLWVSDSGEGMHESLQRRIGERFLRDDPSRQRGTGGAGLGLAIVASIVQLHGGELRIDSGDGQGTRVELLLPRGDAV